MPLTWKEYIDAPDASAKYAECASRCRAAFAQQHENIRRVFEAVAPGTVACLGAGVLNDIPFREFVRAGAAIYLVDWLPGAMTAGIAGAIIDASPQGGPQCLFCDPRIERPEAYCRHYCRSNSAGPLVCDRFVGCPERETCAAYEAGERPGILQEDVTGGYATAFAENVTDELRGVRSWKQALALGLKTARGAMGCRAPLSIPRAGVQLATSSMLISQFEHEPYGFFSRQAESQLGRPSPAEERQLMPAVQELRSLLLRNQVERHCQEIARILAPGGRCYMSFELMHAHASSGWFVVEGMPNALELVGAYFDVQFDALSPSDLISRFQQSATPSLILSCVLTAKAS